MHDGPSKNDRVVRELQAVLELAPNQQTTATEIVELSLDSSWPPEDLGIALFLQNPRSMEILDASAIRLHQ